jgi:predicted RNA binding protein YcfA (HicA-like mRNA interferase family)
MSSHFPPLDCGQVKSILRNLGYERTSQCGSHEHYTRLSKKHGLVKVTVDCPKEPFMGDLIRYMSAQAKLSKKDFYKALNKAEARKLVQSSYE